MHTPHPFHSSYRHMPFDKRNKSDQSSYHFFLSQSLLHSFGMVRWKGFFFPLPKNKKRWKVEIAQTVATQPEANYTTTIYFKKNI